ncbi:unnamed protein product [Rotaria sordida]|uniref:Protein SSUH2 homolog n=1 Tax=Rotaria sordida TaxID=392033 RepID=A0A815K2I2_9BILA|nr:unnamed protein product [Rotaria sordida]
MTKVGPELTLDASQLSEATRPNATDLLPQPTAPPPPRPLPKPLTDFKTNVKWKKVPATWHHERVLHSETLGRLFESTTRGGQPVGDIWDYEVPIPASDNAKSDRSLSHCNYLSRCDNCRGKGLVTCNASGCNGSGWVTCSSCSGRGRTETSTQIIICGCYNGKVRCSSCKGGGKIHCSDCKGGGGFYHSATLRIKWQYQEKLLQPNTRSNNKMRRLMCTVERLNFEEVQYTLDSKYMNKRDSTLGNNFRFCQYPVHGKGLVIYENDYPLNCCGCFGERFACYSRCCTIL